MRTTRLILALLSTCLTATSAQVAIAQVATASVTGTVVDASNAPIADATVTLSAPMLPGGRRSTQTDGTGAFRFTDLAAGGYRLGAWKQGFVPVQEGQRQYRSGGRPFAVRDGERRDVRLRLPSLGVITGRIVDDRGSPMVNASVRALSTTMSAGYRRIQSKAEARTDDRGTYRLHSLWPDSYVVCASTSSTAPLDEAQRLQQPVDRTRQSAANVMGPAAAAAAHERAAALEAQLPARIAPVRGYAPVCHATAAGARSPISIGAGDERAGVDLRLADTRLARIDGTVTGLALGPDQEAMIRLLNQDEALGDVSQSMRIAGDGRFRFWHVPPGRYAMVVTEHASSRNPSPSHWLAAAPLVVADDDVAGVVLDVPKSATVRGEVVLRGQADPGPLVGRVEVHLEPAHHDGPARYVGPYTISPDASGRFEFPAVAPGAYHLSAGLREQPAIWFPDAITVGGRDLLVDALDVKPGQTITGVTATLSQPRGSLSGTLLSGTGEPVPGAAVLVYPVDERYRVLNARRMRYAVSSPDGDYVATGLGPGDYRVATLIDVELGAWYEPELLRQLDATAVTLPIAAGEQKILNLRIPDR